jgi:polyisoprenoid-binding protein YceI
MTEAWDLIASMQPGTLWSLDGARSTVTFRNKTFWGLFTVKGTFAELEGAGEIKAEHAVAGHLRIGAASLSTGLGKRDDHLRSADFFDVANHPAITLDLHGVTVGGTDSVRLDVTLTVRDTARRLDVPATVTRLDDGSLRVTAHATIDRKDFGVDGNLLGMIPDTAVIDGDAVFTSLAGDSF